MMKNDLTIAKIKHTDFAELYDKFIIGKKLNQKQYETLLAIAICFTNADDINVQQWGYRIVVEYCNQTQDYMPLYEIAINKGLYPVSKFIERHYIDDDQRNFFTEWNDAFTEQYISGDICRSEQQDALIKFFEKKYNNTISISAPTSYGKSELILSTIKEYKGRKICVLTSTKALLTQTKKRIQQISKGIFPKVVVHPEMYNSKDVSCLAVLTQERLLRVLKKDPALAFDCIIVDEAHEILENNARSRILDFDRDISWKRLLRIQSNEKHGTYKTRRKMLMDLINDPLFDINDIGGGLINICNRDIGKITNWRKYFISVPGVMDALHDYSAYKPKERYIRIEGDNIFLMGSTRLYGYNKEYYSFALCCMLECLGKYSVRYEDAKGWEDIHHQIEVTEKSTGEVYEIKYRRSDKKFSIYKKDGSATVYANLEDTFNALK